jgi:predicted peroxiredoxin
MATVMTTGTYGSDDPTRAAFPLLQARAALDAGHQAEIFLAGESVYLMNESVANALNPVAWPNVGELIREIAGKGGTFFV